MINRYFKTRGQRQWISLIVILSALWSGASFAFTSGDPEKGKISFEKVASIVMD